jgi:hypothetical protein
MPCEENLSIFNSEISRSFKLLTEIFEASLAFTSTYLSRIILEDPLYVLLLSSPTTQHSPNLFQFPAFIPSLKSCPWSKILFYHLKDHPLIREQIKPFFYQKPLPDHAIWQEWVRNEQPGRLPGIGTEYGWVLFLYIHIWYMEEGAKTLCPEGTQSRHEKVI